MTYKLIISTDIGTDIDDAIAVYIAARHPDIDLKAVWVTNGDVDTRAKIARKLLNYSGSRARVLKGEAEPLSDKLKPYMHGYEKDFLTPRDQYRSQKWSIEENGLEAVMQMIDEEDELYIASIAPMTNLAKLLKAKPDAAKKIKKVYVMGGRISPDSPEHNVRFDVQAAREVLSSDLNLTIVTTDTCDRYMLDAAPLMYNLPKGKGMKFISEMAGAWKLYQERVALVNIGSEISEMHLLPEELTGKNFDELSLVQEFIRESHRKDNLEDLSRYILFIRGLAEKQPELADIKKKLDKADIKEFAVHDAYTIFSIVHPELVQTGKASVTVSNDNGYTDVQTGGQHDLVYYLDYQKFKEFLYNGMRLKKEC